MRERDFETIDWSGPEPEDRWEQDVWLMARRTALLYLHFSRAIISRLGEEEGKALIKQAIMEYGRECGRDVRRGVEEMGLDPTPENFHEVPDLPSRGWRRETVKVTDGRDEVRTTLCPLAVVFGEHDAEKLGRIYCWVDQAKVQGYNDDLECVHEHNVLDGDDYCEIVIRRKETPAEDS